MKLVGRDVGLLGLMVLFATVSGVAQTSGGIVGGFAVSVSGPSATGVPYSAVEETETTQTLANGTHIVSKGYRRLYRDSAGRTRMEMFFPDVVKGSQDDPFTIIIQDPVAGMMYALQAQNHTAQQIDMRHVPTGTPRNGGPIIPRPTPINSPPAQASPKVTSEDLGTQILDGVETVGRRTIRIIPPGLQGNDGPIVVTTEVWNSQELHLVLLTKTSDPRDGETVTRITNLDRSEPDLSLFQIPPDYTIVDTNKN